MELYPEPVMDSEMCQYRPLNITAILCQPLDRSIYAREKTKKIIEGIMAMLLLLGTVSATVSAKEIIVVKETV